MNFKLCKCPNQHLLEDGEVCKICMGVVRFPWVEGPEWAEFIIAYLWLGDEENAPPFRVELPESDPFNELYFEELEHYYDDIDYAA